ncbi:hypothetical protein RI129_002260 [Pyrocoelia pectoralis]|uniref:Proline-rich protein PRCC n=1 Tax=Pyrocoelia pectoralis TaxID=417401 RepID=A0AAN7VLU8_9COLE
MALVSYDSNSDSEYEEEGESESPRNGTVTLTKPVLHSDTQTNHNNPTTLFSNLPPPIEVKNTVIEEEEDEFLYKKEAATEKPQKRIKIDIPALNYSSDEEDKPIERKTKQKVSGLFTLLPPPKGTPLSSTSFVPNVLQKKKTNKKPSTALTPQKRKAAQLEKDKPPDTVIMKSGSDSTDDEEIEIPETYDDATWQEVCGRKKKQPPKQSQEPEPLTVIETVGVEAAPDVDQPYKGLDNKAFKELVGNTKRIPRNIKLIDIHEDEIRPDKEVWLRSLTDPDLEAEPVIENTVDGTRKVKNHITALAEKALANDKELQKRWSENRYNRKQTQAKYGF